MNLPCYLGKKLELFSEYVRNMILFYITIYFFLIFLESKYIFIAKKILCKKDKKRMIDTFYHYIKMYFFC